MDELDDEASPSNVDAASPVANPILKVFEPTATIPESAPKLEVAENASTSSAVIAPKVKNF